MLLVICLSLFSRKPLSWEHSSGTNWQQRVVQDCTHCLRDAVRGKRLELCVNGSWHGHHDNAPATTTMIRPPRQCSGHHGNDSATTTMFRPPQQCSGHHDNAAATTTMLQPMHLTSSRMYVVETQHWMRTPQTLLPATCGGFLTVRCHSNGRMSEHRGTSIRWAEASYGDADK